VTTDQWTKRHPLTLWEKCHELASSEWLRRATTRPIGSKDLTEEEKEQKAMADTLSFKLKASRVSTDNGQKIRNSPKSQGHARHELASGEWLKTHRVTTPLLDPWGPLSDEEREQSDG
jgi:hypothetical protein